jgi:hypothetical protein
MRAGGFAVLSTSIQKRKHGVKGSAYKQPTPTPMTTQTASECPTNSLAVSPNGEHWQAIKVTQEPSLDEIIAKVCRQLEAIETQIETINHQLKNI